MQLSILIPSLSTRRAYLNRLLNVLSPQITLGVECLVAIDAGDKGRGPKRNDLMRQASGKYVVFVDDDDLVTDDYVQQLMCGIEKDVDVVSIRGKQFRDGILWREFMDRPDQRFNQVVVDGVLTLTYGVMHLDAIKREIAIQFEFPDIKFGEDRRWGTAIEQSELVKTWHQVSKPIYLYEYRSVKEV